MTRTRFTLLDVLLVLVVCAWGANLSLVKVAIREFPPLTFNALRLVLASAAFLALIATRADTGPARIARDDWPRVLFLGLVGSTLYQLFFLYGVARTSVANSGLIFGVSPVVISLFSAAVGHERLPWTRWAGGVLSVAGLYLVVGAGAAVSLASLAADGVVFLSMLCWAVYSVASRPLLGTYSPTVLTAWATVVGAVPYTLIAVPSILGTDWRATSPWGWTLTIASSLICLVAGYAIWYTGVQRIGATRTSAYSNLTPIAAMAVAWWWLGEGLSLRQELGAAAILAGVFLTRLSRVALAPMSAIR